MGPEANIESIRALEEQIEEGKGDIIKLKRTRNSLLNISVRVPPEILEGIFSHILIEGRSVGIASDPHFYGFHPNSYNFLLVCYHWFEVASRTPQLWSFWGNTLVEWRKRHHHAVAIPIDLVLYELGVRSDPGAFLDDSLRSTIRDRAGRDLVRQVHLLCLREDLLPSVISWLTPDSEGVHRRSIESIDLQSMANRVLDLSIFFARLHLPRLNSLLLCGVLRMPSWDHLIPQTTLLTTLSLDIEDVSPTPPPTTAQLLSILISNPGIQDLSLIDSAIPEDDGDESTFQVPFPRLKKLCLRGGLRPTLRLFGRLSFPDTFHRLELVPLDSRVEDISEVAPYLRDYLQRARGLRGRLKIEALDYPTGFMIRITDDYKPSRRIKLRVFPPRNDTGSMLDPCFDLVAFIPRDRPCCFTTNFPANLLESLLFLMPNIEELRLNDAVLSEGFLQPNPYGLYAGSKLLPSLRKLSLEDVTVKDDNWGHLKSYLTHQTSGGQAISLEIRGGLVHLCPGVRKEIEGLVEKFKCELAPGTSCPLGQCDEAKG